jgi:AraC-like DNA-binding protein
MENIAMNTTKFELFAALALILSAYAIGHFNLFSALINIKMGGGNFIDVAAELLILAALTALTYYMLERKKTHDTTETAAPAAEQTTKTHPEDTTPEASATTELTTGTTEQSACTAELTAEATELTAGAETESTDSTAEETADEEATAHEEEFISKDVIKNLQFVQQVTEEVDRNIQNENFKIDMLARSYGTCRSAFNKRLREVTGYSPVEFVKLRRIHFAKEMLAATDDEPINAVGYSCGFSTPQYFTRVFKECVGCTPLEYRNRARGIEPRKEAATA